MAEKLPLDAVFIRTDLEKVTDRIGTKISSIQDIPIGTPVKEVGAISNCLNTGDIQEQVLHLRDGSTTRIEVLPVKDSGEIKGLWG